jgi:hypothetical protein
MMGSTACTRVATGRTGAARLATATFGRDQGELSLGFVAVAYRAQHLVLDIHTANELLKFDATVRTVVFVDWHSFYLEDFNYLL